MTTGAADVSEHLVQLVTLASVLQLDERVSNTAFLVIDPSTDDIYEISVRVLDKELMGSAGVAFGTTRLDSIFNAVNRDDLGEDSSGRGTVSDH